MNKDERPNEEIWLSIIFLGVGLGIFWIPYLLMWSPLNALTPPAGFLCIPVGIYMARRGLIGIMKDNAQVAAGVVLLLNVVGIVAFLITASSTWIEPALADVPGASGGAGFVWMLTAVPIFLGFVLLDLLWALLVCLVCPWKQVWRMSWALASIPIIWFGALYFDGVHHGI